MTIQTITSPSDLSFDEDRHRYAFRGVPRAGVTQILSEAHTGRKWKPDPWYMQRGKAIHAAIHLAIQKQLDLDAWAEELHAGLMPDQASAIVGRTRAALRWLAEHMGQEIQSEVRVHHPTLCYAGTLDVKGKLKDGRRAVVDWKGSLSPLAEVQVAAYGLTLATPPDIGAVVELHDDGTSKTWWGSRQPKRDHMNFDLNHAERNFVAALTWRNFLVKNRLLREADRI